MAGKQVGDDSGDVSAAQLTALVSGVMSGLEPMAKRQADVQLAQIAAQREHDDRAFRFARTNLFTGAAVLIVVVLLLALATAYLLMKNHEEEAVRVIWFSLGALGGYGAGRVARPRQ